MGPDELRLADAEFRPGIYRWHFTGSGSSDRRDLTVKVEFRIQTAAVS
jgi:hypothetical protein